MSPLQFVIVGLGLALFEIVSSIDNAVINAQILGTMSLRAQRWFLTWGIITSVVIVRGLLPLIIVWSTTPRLGLAGSFTAAFSSNPSVTAAVATAKPILLTGGGIYLIMLFMHWLFRDDKHYAFAFERIIHQQPSIRFYAATIVPLAIMLWLTLRNSPLISLSAIIGTLAFFLTNALKGQAEAKEGTMIKSATKSPSSDLRKLLYLELIDATFSVDGVLGAFAFTTAVPLILIGNGIGSVIVRQITRNGISTIHRFPYITNGAMYSVGILGVIMLTESLRGDLPFWLSPILTLLIVGFFSWRSRYEAFHAQSTDLELPR
jgi:hypothetical protein